MKIPLIPKPTHFQLNPSNILDLSHAYGAVLLRDWCSSPDNFDEFCTSFQLQKYRYLEGAAPRTKVSKNVFTANESPADQLIPFHHELAQTKHPPKYLFFFCDQPPEKNGRTLLLRSDEFYDYICNRMPSFAEKLKQGIQYTRVMPYVTDTKSPIGRSWKDTFLCETYEEAEDKMLESNMSWRWLNNGDLRVTTDKLPAIRYNADTRRKTFHNSIIAVYEGWNDDRNRACNSISFADGTPIEEKDIAQLQQYAKAHQIEFDWKKGDVLLVDNDNMMHARESFPKTSARRILVSMWSKKNY